MSSPRFFLPAEKWTGEEVHLPADEAKHCAEVLRAKVGDQIVVFDGQGRRADAVVQEISRRSVSVRLSSTVSSVPREKSLVLAQSIPKGKTMDLIIQKATELGASTIVPLLTTNTVVKFRDEADAEKKRIKWERISLEAAKQCGQDWLPTIASPSSLEELFAGLCAQKSDFKLVASLYPGARHLKDLLPVGGDVDVPQHGLIVVGPEGDLSDVEVQTCLAAGCSAMTLGSIVLRSETAAIYCLSVLAHEIFYSS